MGDRSSIRRLLLSLAALTALQFVIGRSCPADDEIRVNPETIRIGAFFSGSRLSVSGKLPSNCEAVIEVIGQQVEEELMRKGRHWDLWMNVGEIDIFGAPRLYYVMSSDSALLAGSHNDLAWGYAALRKEATFQGTSGGGPGSKLFEEFIRLKEEQGLYGKFPQAVQLTDSDEGQITVQGVFHFSTRVAPGPYRVCLSAVRNGRIIQRRCTTLEVSLTGLPAFLSLLASNHEVLYGLMAISFAVAVGLLSGFAFKRGRRKDSC
jgi:hypothetical protein